MIKVLKIPVRIVVDDYEEPFIAGFDYVYYDLTDKSFSRTGKKLCVPLVNSFSAIHNGCSITIDVDYDEFYRLWLDKYQINQIVIALLAHYGITAYDLPDTDRLSISKKDNMAKFLFYFGELVVK